jgi:Xaa-Pro dipeptidase
MRTVVLSPVPGEVRRAADACRDSLNVLIEHMRPGAIASEVAARAKAAWMPICEELIWHGTYAYSVGIGFPPDWNDAPALIDEESDLILQPGMCFHATTSLRRAARYGAAMSETVLITENGNEVLTGTPRELCVV